MLTVFYGAMKQHNHAAWEILLVCGCQTVLIGFNCVLLALSIGNWKKRAGKGKGNSPAASPGGNKVSDASGNDVKSKETGPSQRMIKAKAV